MNRVDAMAGIGLTRHSLPVITYVEFGRDGSCVTAAVADQYRVTVMPSDMVGTYLQQPHRSVYDAILVNGGTGIVGNGKHTAAIISRYGFAGTIKDITAYAHVVHNTLARWESEGTDINPYDIPRIAGLFDAGLWRSGEKYVVLDASGRKKSSSQKAVVAVEAGSIRYISTKTGENPPTVQKIEGRTAGELAAELFSDPSEMCAAAALWDPLNKRWELAVRNLG
ncbi:MAG: hypothetical protein HY516_03140 [Candidatus Aenigmarchaeota archaeon]|nr:hypothetical protein [Candidatus Aenigmarchaeota archaeon]